VSYDNVFVISRSSTLPGGDPGGQAIGINQMIWDPATLTLHVEVNEILDQYREYAVVVTEAIHDELGRATKASHQFKRFDQEAPADYAARLHDAITAAKTLLRVHESDITVASAFTTYVLKGDQSTVNPSATECLTDSGLLPHALYYRHDLAFAQDPTILKNPHMILFQSTSPNTLVRTIARGMQAQMAEFHASGGTVVNTPEPAELWEVPMVDRPDSLNFIR
jgi:hypothetical protein